MSTDVRYKSLVDKMKDKKITRSLICKSDISLSNMACSALENMLEARNIKSEIKVQINPAVLVIFQKHQILIADLLIVTVNSLNAE